MKKRLADTLTVPTASISDAELILQALEIEDKRRQRARPDTLFIYTGDEQFLLRLDSEPMKVRINLPQGTDTLELIAYEDNNPEKLLMANYVLFYLGARVEPRKPVDIKGFGKVRCKFTYDSEENVIAEFRVIPEDVKKLVAAKKSSSVKRKQSKRKGIRTNSAQL